MRNFIFPVLLTVVFLFISCMETWVSDSKHTTVLVDNLQVPSGFDWATAHSVQVHIVGLPTILPVKSTITIQGDSDVFYSGFHALSDTLDLKVLVPATVKDLTLKCGSIQKISEIVDGKVQFHYY